MVIFLTQTSFHHPGPHAKTPIVPGYLPRSTRDRRAHGKSHQSGRSPEDSLKKIQHWQVWNRNEPNRFNTLWWKNSGESPLDMVKYSLIYDGYFYIQTVVVS